MSYVPMGGFEPSVDNSAHFTMPSRSEPKVAWVLAFLPVLQLVQFPFGSATALPTLAVIALTAAIGVWLAFVDQRQLRNNGHLRATTPWLAIVPLVYLGLRGSRRFDETGYGMKPFWIGLAVFAGVVFLLIWGPEGVLALLL